MSTNVQGLAAYRAGIAKIQASARAGAREAAAEMGALLEAETKKNLSQSSHRRGTPTPSRPGQPPAVISGTGRRSIRVDPVSPVDANTFRTQVGPTVIYMRIQELGGRTGRGHRTVLPPRPYLAPANNDLLKSGRYRETFLDAFRRALS